MESTNLQSMELLSIIDINEAISYIIVDHNPKCEDLYDSLYQLIKKRYKTTWRIINSKRDEQQNEYSDLVRTQLNELNIDYDSKRIILAINPFKLPVGFIPFKPPVDPLID